MKTSLVIMAAGLGSRYGGGIKQLAKVGQCGEIIMDYSIHDAIEAGFNKIIFIIRKDIENDFMEAIGNRIERLCNKYDVEVCYCFQDLNDLPDGYIVPDGRVKPWGTGHAVLAARHLIKEPFMVINADDYYGKECYKKMHNYLINIKSDTDFSMAGFILKNTLSDNGAVNRGICLCNEDHYLTDVKETLNIVKDGNTAKTETEMLDINSIVSMNMWGLTPYFINVLEKAFIDFLNNLDNPTKNEFLLPTEINKLIKNKIVTCKVLDTNDKWLGVTYQEDKQFVIDSINELINQGIYKKDLYSDL
ncbi:MAG: NDP-sugar synthase [Anaeroplasma sp.]